MKKTNHSEDQKSALEQAIEQAKRLAADYQNLEKRITQEKAGWIKSANKELITNLLPALDDLYRANKHLQDDGLRLIIQKLVKILNDEGLTEIPPTVGQEFVPESMRSLATVDAEEEKVGRVVEEVRSGYKLNGEVIRPAEVIVGQKKVELTN